MLLDIRKELLRYGCYCINGEKLLWEVVGKSGKKWGGYVSKIKNV